MNSYISILGLYNYKPDLFDDMQLPESINEDIAVNEILLRCGDLEVLYPNADFMKAMIAHWSKANAYTFSKMAATLELEYNPIWNKDGTITEMLETSGTGEDTSAVKGFNSDSWADSVKGNSQTAGSSTRTRVETGNIGVTTTQSMIREERDISEFNIYSYIADRFKETFCVLVY